MENSAAYEATAKEMTSEQLQEVINILLRTSGEESPLLGVFATELCNRLAAARVPAEEAPATMKLVTINGNGGNDPYDVMVHRADCGDVPKAIKGHDHFFEEHPSKRALWLDYNSDFLAEGSGAWPIHFYPCTAGLPDGGSYNTETDE